MKTRPIYIYALCEPGTRTVRYIGKTVNLHSRLSQHRNTSSRQSNHLGAWLRSLTAPPEIVALSIVPPESASDEERRYIFSARTSLGMDLVNGTDGGEGVTLTPEVLSKIKATRSRPENAAAISASCRKLWTDPGYRQQQSVSRKAAWSVPGERERRGKAMGDAARTETRRQAKRDEMKKQWANPQYRAAHAAGMAKNRDKFREAASARVTLGIKRKWASSRFIGVSWENKRKRWVASVVLDGKLKTLGRFISEVDAARCVDSKIRSLNLKRPVNFPI